MTCSLMQNSDFQVVFSPVTMDGGPLYFPNVTGWFFSVGSGFPTPFLRYNSVANSGQFIIDPTGKTVSVAVPFTTFSASGGSYGTYFVALYAATSGNYITHKQQSIVIQQQLAR